MKHIYLSILVLFSTQALAVDDLHGEVHAIEFSDTHQDTVPLIAANIFWQGTTTGTTSDEHGHFQIPRPAGDHHDLVINYVGYENDTLHVEAEDNNLVVYLNTHRSADEVLVSAEMLKTVHRKGAAVNTEVITSNGLTQLACCSLAESFENTTSVEVEESDAVTGAKRIKMLGLSGVYTQVLMEKKPVMRGLVSPYSLEYVPGFWMESVNISKGTASVATGYESITGQINIELKKPERSEPFSANAYVNSMGKADLALLGATEVNDNLSTMLLTYGTILNNKWDTNEDTFLDKPLMQQLNIMNRWKYVGDAFRGQLGIKLIHDDRLGGQVEYDFDEPQNSPGVYGSRNTTNRQELYAKGGVIFDESRSSLGVILSAFQHDIDAFAGMKTYTGKETSVFSSLFYDKNLREHRMSLGLSYQYDDRKETYLADEYDTSERVPGVFGEYSYEKEDEFTALLGLRYDDHNQFGGLLTPRAHFNYQPDFKTSIKASAGKGYRYPRIFVDNPSILASSRTLVIQEELEIEEAWNAGLQLTRDLYIAAYDPVTLVLDYYRTEFQNQTVVDREQSTQNIYLYNLDGRSFSNAFQAEISATPMTGFDVTTAVRYNEVKTTYGGVLEDVPMNVPYKGLLVLSYSTPNEKWGMNLTTQFNGKSRLPNTTMNPVEYQLDEYSPRYTMMFAQLKYLMEDLEIYAGIENLMDYRQEYPILAWEDPFSSHFDSSIIWGPTDGRRFYIGFRYR